MIEHPDKLLGDLDVLATRSGRRLTDADCMAIKQAAGLIRNLNHGLEATTALVRKAIEERTQ